MKIDLTPSQVELLNDVLAMQLQIETEHLDNCLDGISKHNTRLLIGRMDRLRVKINRCAAGGDDVK